jgi:hypothetical protein
VRNERRRCSLERGEGQNEMATQVTDEKMGKDKNFFVFVDGEKCVPSSQTMTPNELIAEATPDLDPNTHYLLRTNRGQESFKDKGGVPITLEKGDRFQVVSVGPTPVS